MHSIIIFILYDLDQIVQNNYFINFLDAIVVGNTCLSFYILQAIGLYHLIALAHMLLHGKSLLIYLNGIINEYNIR